MVGMSRWASLSLSKDLWARTRAGWRSTPRGSLPRLLIGLAAAWVVAAAVIAGLTLGAKAVADDGLHAWDERHARLADAGEGWASLWPLRFTDAVIFESPANILILLPLTLFAAAWSLWRGQVVLATAFVLNYAMSRFLIWLGWHLWDRERPQFVADGAAALSAHSFPSGHTLLTFTTYGLLTFLWMRASRSAIEKIVAAVALLALAFVVAYARVRMGAHWPSDCIAGAAGGVVWLTGVCLSFTWAERR